MASKEPGLINLTQAELKLIALGVRFATGPGGKVDYDKVAKYGGYTRGSAQVMYRKALRKLTDGLDIPDTPNAEGGGSPSAPKTPKTAQKGDKRSKDAVDGKDVNAATTTGGEFSEIFVGDFREAMTDPITPSKRQKKSPAKKTVTKLAPISLKTEEHADSEIDLLKEEDELAPTVKTE